VLNILKVIMDTEYLLKRWQNLIHNFTDAENASDIGENIIARYNESHRFYHNIEHLSTVLKQIDFAKGNIGISAYCINVIELALWYHDAIYDPKANDNEEKSADLFIKDARQMRINENVIINVSRLILVTKNHFLAKSLDEQIIADCDLSPLGHNKEYFENSNKNLLKEYPDVPEIERIKFLQSLIEHESIFHTFLFRREFEDRAISNIKDKIASFS